MNRAFIVTDLGFGDSGKGGTVDALSRRFNSTLTVRHGGSCQAAHNVHTADGRHHVFAQLGSGTFAGAKTLLGKGMTVNPISLLNETDVIRRESAVADILERIYIDARCQIVTPVHRLLNHFREKARGSARHGSCGMGVGEQKLQHINAPWLTIYAAELPLRSIVKSKLSDQIDYARLQFLASGAPDDSFEQKLDAISLDEVADAYYCAKNLVTTNAAELIKESTSPVFEGAQGVLLDELYGFFPYTTWSDTTPAPAMELLKESDWIGGVHKVGVIRTYMTRHGDGPFPSESTHCARLIADDDNRTGEWQGALRAGWLDIGMVKYAIASIGGINSLSITHTDKLEVFGGSFGYHETHQNLLPSNVKSHLDTIESCNILMRAVPERYPEIGSPFSKSIDSGSFVATICNWLSAPPLLISFGKTSEQKEWATWRAFAK